MWHCCATLNSETLNSAASNSGTSNSPILKVQHEHSGPSNCTILK